MTEEYLNLLIEGKIEEAEELRISENPKVLYKFVSLNGTEEDEKRFATLQQNSIWFSSVDLFNDPYEHKGMILDREYMIAAGIQDSAVAEYEELFATNDLEVTSLSASGYNNLPMWAYYSNNSQGFCIEYDVLNRSAVHEVLYESERIKVGHLIIYMLKNAVKAMRGDEQAIVKAKAMVSILMNSMYIKDLSWKHEREYRITIPIRERAGENIPISLVGLKVKSIVAGIYCKEENIERLAAISKEIGCENFYCAKLSEKNFGIELRKYDKE